MTRRLIRVRDQAELVRTAAEECLRVSAAAVTQNGQMSWSLAGGTTPQGLYRHLSGDDMQQHFPWASLHLFWGDERHVPPDHPESNFRMAFDSLITRVPIPPDHIHRIRSEIPDAEEAANRYESELRDYFRRRNLPNPRFDLILLGMGPDGHTASLFPGTAVVHEATRWVAAPWIPHLGGFRITMTPAVLNEAMEIIFLVSGLEKADTLRHVLEGPYQPDRYPAQVIKPKQGRLLWIVDEAAATHLDPSVWSSGEF